MPNKFWQYTGLLLLILKVVQYNAIFMEAITNLLSAFEYAFQFFFFKKNKKTTYIIVISIISIILLIFHRI